MTDITATIPLDDNKPLGQHRDFRLLWLGGAASLLGDQLTLVAFPWLILMLSQDALVLGTALALLGLPRAVFILLGGAIVDRYSSKTILLISKCINAVVLLLLSFLIYQQQLTIPVLYVFSFILGLSSAFSMPAGSSILPGVVGGKNLGKANGIFMILSKLTMLIGPLLAGFILGSDTSEDLNSSTAISSSLAFLFALDAFTFIFSAMTLMQVNYKAAKAVSDNKNLLQNITEGFAYFWQSIQLRTLSLYIAVASFVVGGLVQVGLPILIKTQLAAGGDVFGYLLATQAFGGILGLILSVKKIKTAKITLGVSLLSIDIAVGLLIAVLGSVQSLLAVFSLLFMIGLLVGYIQADVFTWIQRQSSVAMLGRMMSIIMFVSAGLAPVAAVLYGGLLSTFAVGDLFIVSGCLLSSIAILGLLSKQIRTIVHHSH